MKQSNIKKNFAYNILYQILIIILPLITSPYLTRVIGADGLGIYTFTQSYAHYFALFILLGVSNYGNREIAKARDVKEDASRVFWEIYSFQGGLLVLISAIYSISIFLFVKDNTDIYWLQLLYVLSAGFDINWCCFGLEKFKLTVIRNSIIKISTAVLIFLLIHTPADLWIYTALSAGAMLLSQLVVWPFIIKELGFCKVSWKGIISHIIPNLTLFLPVVAISLYTIMDKLMLGVLDVKTEVAFYTYAGRLIEVPEAVVIALTTVLLPRASNMIHKGKEKENLLLMTKSMQFTMLFCMGAAFGLAAVANLFIPWYYGLGFSRCTVFTIWLSPVIVLTSWNGIIRNQFVIPKGYDKVYLITVTAGAIVNLLLNYLLIPPLHGLGAVIGTDVAQITVCIVQYYLIRKEIDYSAFVKDTVAFFICGLLMAIAIVIFPTIGSNALANILLEIIIGIVIYALLTYIYLVKIQKDRVLFDSVIGMFKKR